MNITEMSMADIETRKAELLAEMAGEVSEERAAEIDAETAELETRKAELNAIEQRKADAKALENRSIAPDRIIESVKEERKTNMEINSVEYRSLWLRAMQGYRLEGEEKRAFDTTGGAIATQTANSIMTVVRDHAPLLEDMTIIYSPATVSYYIEDVNDDAVAHTENATIAAASDTLKKITLNPTEIVKLIQVSEAAKQMSVDAFESWLSAALGEAIARKINALVVAAISAAATSAGTSITASTVQDLLGTVKGDRIRVICNRKTLFTALLPLQDNSKHNLVSFAGSDASLYGIPVRVDDNVADNVVLAGDMSKAVAAMAESVFVRQAYDINTNSYKYLGGAMFDTKIGVAAAFAKLA